MNTLDEYLKSLTKEQWIEEIKNKGFAYQTIEYSTLPLQHSTVEALEDVIKNFVKSESDFINCTDQIAYLIEKTKIVVRYNVLQRISGIFLSMER